MTRVPGSVSAVALLRVGLGHAEVVRALIREIGLDEVAAERAWAAALGGFEADQSPQAWIHASA